MAETRVVHPHSARRRLRKHASTVIRVVPLGVVLPMIFFLGSVGPDDFARNYAGWARKWGLTDWAEWLAQYATGPRVFWTVVLFSGVYLAIVFGLPALIQRTKKNVTAVIVPVSVTAILIIVLYAWSLITPRNPPQWNIAPEQDDELKVALSEAANKYNVVISVVPAAPTDAMDAGYHLMQIIGASPGWRATVVLIDPEYSPKASGLRVSVKVFTDPEKNEKAVVLKAILDKAGLHPFWGNDHGLADGEAKIVVGVHP